jgi:hypothetical protein
MPSITFWNRIEPSPRSDRLERHVAAQVRDPMWFLTRQWQFGEYQGEDAATPAWIEMQGRFSPITGWLAPGEAAEPFQNGAPLEELIQTEGLTPDWATRVELGQYFESLLTDAGMPLALAGAFRGAYAILQPDVVPEAERDIDLRRLLAVCAGRAIDGVALLDAIRDAAPQLPADPPLPPTVDPEDVKRVVEAFVGWVAETFGDISRGDAPAWRADRLEYEARVTAISPDERPITLQAHLTVDGGFDWYAFDQLAEGTADDDGEPLSEGSVRTFSRSVLPTRVTFPGMPNTRWWHFEDGRHDAGELRANRLELGKIMLLDFMLVHGNDWYVLPFAQEVGTLCRIDSLLVHDVFGDLTLVRRADAKRSAADPEIPWSMFSVEAQNGARTDYFVLAPSAISSSLQGEPIEEVRFMRDETANMAWAIERSTENGTGRRWPGHERADRLGSEPREYVPANPDDPPVKYFLQTQVPEHWIPLVPRQIDATRRAIVLERGAVLRPGENGEPPRPVRPLGRILNPSAPAHNPRYTLAEEEVPREGREVRRRMERCRWIDGSTHLWVARSSRPGFGETRSGLRFDLALEARKRGE